MHFRIFTMTLSAVAVLLLGAPRPLLAQDWPNKPITLVVAATSGGVMDAMSRLLAQDISAALGQPVPVEFKGGAGGVVGNINVAKAAPDGYTLLLQATGAMVFRPLIDSTLGYDADKDFTPIILVGDTPNAVMVNPKLGVKNIKELIAYAATKDRKLTFGHPGPGTMGHLCGILLARQINVEGIYVAYRGGSQIITDLMGGQIDLGTPAYGPNMDPLMLGLASEQRLDSKPDMPTLKEVGADVECATWFAVFAPANLPAAMVKRLNEIMNVTLAKRETHERFAVFGLRPLGGSPERLTARMAADRAKWGGIIAGVNFDLSK